jgi:hypothetical protein
MMEQEQKPEGRRGPGRRARTGGADRHEAAGHIADGIAGLLYSATEPLWGELNELQQRVRDLERKLAAMHAAGGQRVGRPPGGRGRALSSRVAASRSPGTRRIRWGNSDEEIRQTVLAEAARIRDRTGKLDVATLRAELPSVFRFLYGDRAVFAGVKGLAAELGS